MFASWLSFLIPAAWISVHAPGAVATGAFELAIALDEPRLLSPSVLAFLQGLTVVTIFLTNAILFSGYLIFSFAPRAEGSRTSSYVLALVTCGVCMLIYPFSAWVWGGVWKSNMASGLFLLLAWFLYIVHCARIDGALAGRYVLFFRRFDSFADLSILPTLLRLTPRRTPLVMLVSGTENEIGYWDPVKLMSYGLHSNLPWGGRPVFLRGGEGWESVMKKLVSQAGIIVVDRTEKSEAMTKEMRTVAKSGRPAIVIAEKADEREADRGVPEGDQVVPVNYERGRGQFVFRLGLVLAIVVAVALLVDLPGQIQEKYEQGELLAGLFGAAIMLGFVTAISGGLLLRRGLSRGARGKIAAAMKEGLKLGHS